MFGTYFYGKMAWSLFKVIVLPVISAFVLGLLIGAWLL